MAAKHVVGTSVVVRAGETDDAIPTEFRRPTIRARRDNEPVTSRTRRPRPLADKIINMLYVYLPKYETHLKLKHKSRSMYLTLVSERYYFCTQKVNNRIKIHGTRTRV